ncbi:UNVERIFIED_ORG: hypothetical protein J2740_004572 [Rhizobium nepotum]|nr:hypothetical protein [Rhizobium nepotum]
MIDIINHDFDNDYLVFLGFLTILPEAFGRRVRV